MQKPIVVLEDDSDLRQLVSELLSEHGYTIHIVRDVQHLLAEAQRLAPCVALIDSLSPTEFDLWHLGPILSRLGVPAIAFTAHATAQRQFETHPNGYIGVVSKPFDADVFVDLVNSICWEESQAEAS